MADISYSGDIRLTCLRICMIVAMSLIIIFAKFSEDTLTNKRIFHIRTLVWSFSLYDSYILISKCQTDILKTKRLDLDKQTARLNLLSSSRRWLNTCLIECPVLQASWLNIPCLWYKNSYFFRVPFLSLCSRVFPIRYLWNSAFNCKLFCISVNVNEFVKNSTACLKLLQNRLLSP